MPPAASIAKAEEYLEQLSLVKCAHVVEVEMNWGEGEMGLESQENLPMHEKLNSIR